MSELKPIEKSSNVQAIGHDPAKNELTVLFHGTKPEPERTYVYSGVTADHHKALMAAPSVGSHMAAHIVGKFTHRKGS